MPYCRACPRSRQREGRATISNGLSYATGANNPHLDIVKDVLKFFGSEEGQRIQGESGAAIPAYEGLEDTWVVFSTNIPLMCSASSTCLITASKA